MAQVDLADNVAGNILKVGSEAFQLAAVEANNNAAYAHNLLRLSASRRFDEVGLIEGRTASGVLATPIASPTTQQP